MPRPISWLPRLHEIRRAVDGSVRSHYDRRDLERLFEVQPRSAQKLIELFPALTVGTSRLVEREASSPAPRSPPTSPATSKVCA